MSSDKGTKSPPTCVTRQLMANKSPFQPLMEQLSAVGRRIRMLHHLRTTILCVASIALLGLLALLIFASWAPNQIAVTLTTVLLVAICFGYGFLAWRQIRQDAGSPAAIATLWERRQSNLKDGLIACVHFAESWDSHFRGDRQKALELVHWVRVRTAETQISDIVEWSRLRRPGYFIMCAFVIWGAALLATPEALQRGWAAVITANAVKPQATVEAEPLLADIHLTIDPPAYAKKERRLVPNSTGEFKVLSGTLVTVRARTTRIGKQAFAIVGDQEVLAKLENDTTVEFPIKVTAAMDWRFGMVSTDGTRAIEDKKRRITIIPDLPPSVSLDEPARDMELEYVRAVPITFSGQDDFGIAKVAILLALAGDEENPTRIPQDGYQGKKIRGADEIDLSVIEAQPGDRIAVFVEAIDNREAKGAQRSVSATRYITVRSPEFAHYEITEALHALIDILLDALAGRLEVESIPKNMKLVQELTALSKQTLSALDRCREIFRKMENDPLTVEEIRATFKVKIDSLEGAARNEQTAIDQYPRTQSSLDGLELQAASRVNEKIVTGFEELIIYVEAIVSRLALEDIAAMTNEIKAAKARLRELVGAYKKKPSDALKARVLRNIRRLRQRMKALQARLAKLRQKLPDEFLNIEGLKSGKVSKGLSDTRSKLDSLEKMLEENRIDDALKAIDEMSETLDELSSALDKDMQDLHDRTNPELQKALSELMDQTRDVLKRQESIAKETETFNREEQKRQAKLLKKQLKERLDALLEKAYVVRATAEKIAAGKFPAFSDEYLADLQQRIMEVIQSLKAARLRAALEAAINVQTPLYGLKRHARMIIKGPPVSGLVTMGQTQNNELIESIKELLKNAQGQMAMNQDQQKGEQLRQQQQSVSKAAKQLRREMNRRSKMIPGLQGEPLQSMDGAQQAMGRAEKSLRGNRPGHARPNQDEAISKLKGLMNGLKKAAQPQKQSRGERDGRQDGRRGTSRQKVRIPGADEHDAPAEFRKELMDAMKGKAPSEFRESVKRYYESLVK